MDTKLKNRILTIGPLIVSIYMVALSLLLSFDIITHMDYLKKDPYFNSSSFNNELVSIFDNIQHFHITYNNYEKKTPEEKVTKDEFINSLKVAEQNLATEENDIENNFNSQIFQARNEGNTEKANSLIETKSKMLKEVRSKAKTEEMIKKEIITYKDNDYNNVKKSISLTPFKYYIENLKTKEIYTNIYNVTNIEAYIKDYSFYSVKFPQEGNTNNEFYSINSSFINQSLKGYFIVPKSTEGFSQIHENYNYYNSIRDRIIKEILISLVCFIATIYLILYLYKKQSFSIIHKGTNLVKRIPLDLRLILYFVFSMIVLAYMVEVPFFYTPLSIVHLIKITFTTALSLISIVMVFDIYKLIRNKENRKEQWNDSIIKNSVTLLKECFLYKNVLFKVLLIVVLTVLFGIFVAAFMLSILRGGAGELAFISFLYIILYLAVVPNYVLRRVATLNKIMYGTKEINAGNFNYTIEAKGKGEITNLAKDINNMNNSFKAALQNEMKSERLKSELITNVSHDLKTPLTSIINYVDIIKMKNSSKENIDEYIEILDRKAQRLKTLIEDLFEVSKMTSGSVELNLEKIDIAALLNQAIGEFNDKIESSSLKFKVTIPSDKIYANLDGKKTWRAFENLIGNAIKYSLPNTRVFIDLKTVEDTAILTFKNVASYEMDFNPEEIFERFKRGDKSRNTDGSGLGLAIAKSIIDLQQGTFNIETDGDLFKAIIKFKI